MRLRQTFPVLTVALVATAALGPPVAGASGGGGGATAAPGSSTGSGGGTYGHPAPKQRKSTSRRRTSRASSGRHVFPLAGSFEWGARDGRFGARRRGHRHQGQDLTAAAGTPVVAPRGGVVEAVRYQARGAGHYVVVDGDREDYDYVFMHLAAGSIPVEAGQQVRMGEVIGAVGSTGSATGPHLHLEIWVGGWPSGAPIDPLPLLQAWAA